MIFDQARQARDHGFLVVMRYVALQDVEQHLERIALRAQSGGHAASESVLRAIHRASLKNLPRALRELDSVSVFDNSQFGQAPLLVLEVLAEVETGKIEICLRNLEMIALTFDMEIWELLNTAKSSRRV